VPGELAVLVGKTDDEHAIFHRNRLAGVNRGPNAHAGHPFTNFRKDLGPNGGGVGAHLGEIID
jgi:hypothetical protein